MDFQYQIVVVIVVNIIYFPTYIEAGNFHAEPRNVLCSRGLLASFCTRRVWITYGITESRRCRDTDCQRASPVTTRVQFHPMVRRSRVINLVVGFFPIYSLIIFISSCFSLVGMVPESPREVEEKGAFPTAPRHAWYRARWRLRNANRSSTWRLLSGESPGFPRGRHHSATGARWGRHAPHLQKPAKPAAGIWHA